MRNIINTVNWLAMLLLSLVTAAFGIISLLLLGGIIPPLSVSPAGALFNQWNWIARLSGADATTGWILFSILTVAGIAFTLFELLALLPRQQREPSAYTVRRDGLGEVKVARKSVRDLVQHEAATVPGVIEVRPDVREGPQGLQVYAHTSLAPGAEATVVGQQLQEKIQTAVQRQMGLPVSHVQVMTQIEPINGSGQRRVR